MKRVVLLVVLLTIGIIAAFSIYKSSKVPNQPPLETPIVSGGEDTGVPVNIDVVIVDANKVKITGRARGSWFFEASFPVRVLDANGQELGRGAAQAQAEWMTTELVPFVANINFKSPATETGTLLMAKDNPSGLPENDQQFQFPIRFK